MTLHFQLPRAARSGVALFPIVLALAGCAATITQDGVEQRTAIAIGRPAGSFTISNQAEGTAGRIDYSVKTKDGKTFSCYLYSATGFQRAMSFGQTPHSDAICTVQSGADAAAAPCNALEKAAGRCPPARP